VSQQNLLIDDSGRPISHPEVSDIFDKFLGDSYAVRPGSRH
jgi:hemimethylated DNA binding protein